MNKPLALATNDWLADTHHPENHLHELCDYNLYTEDVGDAFCRSRLDDAGGLNYGTLPTGVNVAALIDRATPRAA